jgi:chromosome partitioning protein
MQIISFMNMKGGVGKTTLAVNVAYGLAYHHKKTVLIVDGDPQFNATQYLLGSDAYLKHLQDDKKGTLRDIFVPRRPGPVKTVVGASKPINKAKMALAACTCSIFNGGANHGKLDLIPSTLQLMDIETSRRGTEQKLKTYLHEKREDTITSLSTVHRQSPSSRKRRYSLATSILYRSSPTRCRCSACRFLSDGWKTIQMTMG